EAVAIPNSPAYCLRGLYKPADEYFIDGKPCTPDEYIAWQAGIIEAVTKAKLPDPKYYGGSAEEGDQHDVKCAYVDGWNDCRASILAAPQPAQADARVGLTAIQAVLREIDPKWRERGEFGVKPHDQIIAAIRDLAAHPGQPEPRASAGVIAAALAVIEADRAQTLTTEHIDALDNAIKIQRGELNLPEPRA
ncbi:TPA: hypothetical protein QDA71_006719, partial [Burkholderia vietnamiensis]|nr:hypothetical protein [Burkholderia vietnamiensis]HDR9211299.1 hypothetical protein [Burkholderia vietnamiensis]